MSRGRRHSVLLTEGAKADLQDIYRYIASQESVARADAILRNLEDAGASLAQLPERGNIPKELRALGISEFRETHVAPYRIIYRILAQRVFIHCVLDGRRDMQSLLQRRLLR